MGNSITKDQKIYYRNYERMAKTDTCLLNVTSLLRLLQTDNIVIAQTVENRQTVDFLRCRAPEAHITKTYLLKYTENFTTKNENFQSKNSDISQISDKKNRLLVIVRTASLRRF